MSHSIVVTLFDGHISDYGEKETLKNIVIQNHSIEKAKSPIETGQPTHAVNGGWPSAGKSSFKPSSISSFHETSSVAFDSRETIDYPNEPSIWSKNDSRGPVSKQKIQKFRIFINYLEHNSYLNSKAIRK